MDNDVPFRCTISHNGETVLSSFNSDTTASESTSNHNSNSRRRGAQPVVIHSISTSNHNLEDEEAAIKIPTAAKYPQNCARWTKKTAPTGANICLSSLVNPEADQAQQDDSDPGAGQEAAEGEEEKQTADDIARRQPVVLPIAVDPLPFSLFVFGCSIEYAFSDKIAF